MLVKKKVLIACGTSTSELELYAHVSLILQYQDAFIVDKLHFNKFSPTLTFSPNPQGKSRFTFGERKQMT